MKISKIAVSLIAAGVMVSPLAYATNGYFSHGYGMKAKGMAGVGIALPQDSLAAATNPAGIVMVGNRMDVGLDLFRPDRSTDLPAVMGGGNYSGNGDSSFFIPEFGYNKSIDADSAFGVAVYGNGGMNTKYNDLNTLTGGGIFGTGDLGVDLSQLFIAPTYARKINADNSLGVSLNLAYQRFKAEGLQNFDNGLYSSAPGSVTNNGYDSSTGWGVRIGWTGQVTPTVTLGATYQSKTKMGKFDKYKGLFAEQGGFDIPANYGVGIAFKLNDSTTLAADVQTIQYSGVKSIANPQTNTAQLGADNGSGFGWRDMTAIKLAASHKYEGGLEVRAGLSTGKQPIPEDQTFFNVLAPGVIENHLTLGATWTLANKSEVTVGYMHAFKNTVNGAGNPAGAPPGINLNMSEDSLGVAYGWKM